MSHITMAKTELTDLGSIKAALNFLGISFKESAEARLWNTKTTGDIVIPLKRFDIAIKQKDDEIILEADSMAWGELSLMPVFGQYHNLEHNESFKEQFSGLLKQAYSMAMVQEIASQRGDSIIFNKPDKNNIITANIQTRSIGI